jgi:parallel beta-helix repeat protein
MPNKPTSLIILLTLMMCTTAITLNIHPTNAQPTTIYVDGNNTTGPWNGTSTFPYQNITSGLEYANTDDTIFVRTGTYYEDVEINKTITLTGQNQTNTIIDGKGQSRTIIRIAAPNVVVANLTIKNSASDIGYGILIFQTQNVTITKNTITETFRGVVMNNASQSKIFNNQISSNYAYGISLLSESNQNLFTENNIAENSIGTSLDVSCQDNMFYHNNFINNNVYQVDNVNYGTRTKWNSTYPTGGNYWSDYAGVDLKSGPNQNLNGSDGIGDTPYVAGGARDYYPLMQPYTPIPPIAKFTYTPETPVKNEIITFNASASYDLNGSIASYKWDFDDENTTTVTNPIITHSYANYGNYTVSLTITDNEGLASTTTKTVAVQKKTSTLSIEIHPTNIEIGKNTIISGNLSIQGQPPNQMCSINISTRVQGEANWTTLTIAATNLSGFYQYNWTPSNIKTYELEALWEGNETALPANSSKVTLNVNKKSSTLTISSNPSKVTIGQNITITGKLEPEKEGANIVISHYDFTSGSWITITVAKTDYAGNYVYNWTTTETGVSYIKASWSGDDQTIASEDTITVTIDQISSIITVTADKTNVIVGTNITISGEITPSRVNVNVTLTLSTADGTSSWNTIVKTDANGDYTYIWTPSTKGTYRIKASWQGDSITAPAQSKEIEVDIQQKAETPFSQYVIAAAAVLIIFIILGIIIFKTKKK